MGIHCLFLLVGSFRNLVAKNKQKEVPRFFYNYTNGTFGANFPQTFIHMKNIFILICAVFCSVQSMAALSLVVKPLSGKECITALENVGKIVYSDDSIFVYDLTKELVFSDLLLNIQHVRFSEEQSSTPNNVENLQGINTTRIVVYPNPTKDVLHVKNVKVEQVRLYTIAGSLLQTVQVYNGEVLLNLSAFQTGNYLLLCGNEAFQVIKQ